MYIESHIPIHEAILYAKVGHSHAHVQIIDRISKQVSSGINLSLALSRETHFPSIIIGILRTGEQSGSLLQALKMSGQLLERRDEMQRKIVSSLTYPILIALFAGLLVIGLMRGVMPQIVPMLKGLNIELPLLTKATILASDIISAYGLIIFLSSICLTIVLMNLYRKVSLARYITQQCIFKLPILGSVFFTVSFSIFIRSFGSMLQSHIPVKESYLAALDTLHFLPFKRELEKYGSYIDSGKKITDIFSKVRTPIPLVAMGIIGAGEKSGTLGISMIRVADIIDRDVDHKIKRVTSLLEPLMMMLLGLIIGAIALSIVMPIYDISKVLQR